MKICVFCGSSFGKDEAYRQAAELTGKLLAQRGIELIYGGGHVGLMGVIADAVLSEGGQVTGVIPRALAEREIAHKGLTTLVVVESMHERKAEMAKRADGFISLPGGAGTLEEAFEQWTWAQLGVHQKPSGFLNMKGYFDPLRAMIKKMVTEGFLKPEYADMLVFFDDPARILSAFESYAPPSRKWASGLKM
ncbi:MAG: TIGR00730 family Rossman fold protein [Gammaproteobacteria bacterium]|nr:TIGR00730 family Rossman fold protein [Gammaproteobacteria bacterium]MDH3414646.1 TIGR00730 family Rossman fold protein [Gammaproteobacteria bacterium]